MRAAGIRIGKKQRSKKPITQEVQGPPELSSGSRELLSYCSKRMFLRSPLLIRTIQSFSWKRPCCSALPPLSRRLTNKPRVLKCSNVRVKKMQEDVCGFNMAALL